jgi:hypothetical protein
MLMLIIDPLEEIDIQQAAGVHGEKAVRLPAHSRRIAAINSNIAAVYSSYAGPSAPSSSALLLVRNRVLVVLPTRNDRIREWP